VHRDGFIEVAIRHEIQDRRKRLALHDRPVILGLSNTRGDVKSAWIVFPVEPHATRKDPSTQLLQLLHSRHHFLHSAFVNQWTNKGSFFQGIADLKLLVRRYQRSREPVFDGFMNNDATRCRASLARSPYGAKENRSLREIEIR